MKYLLPIVAALVVTLNALLLVPALAGQISVLAAVSLALAAVMLVLSLIGRPGDGTMPRTIPVTTQPPLPAANQAEAEIVAFVGLLQEKGRFVDFVMEEVGSVEDAQLGAAARVVHQGCREVIRDNLQIVPVAEAPEGSPVTVPAGYDAAEYRLTGRVAGEPPFSGRLVHKGWKAGAVKLPRILRAGAKPVIAPAEVELA